MMRLGVRLSVLLPVVLLLTGCWSSPRPTASGVTSSSQAAATVVAGSTPTELCLWFMKTQMLRAERIAGGTALARWFTEYAGKGETEIDAEMVAELFESMKELRPHEARFIESWQQLGTFAGGEEFWSKELEAEQMRLAAIDTMLMGNEKENDDEFDRGWRMFLEAAPVGRQAEAAMFVLRDKCVP